MAATARRRAVLGGLAKLGYEVRETMATAWANDGRLVLRKPNANDYGIELERPVRCLSLTGAARWFQSTFVAARCPS